MTMREDIGLYPVYGLSDGKLIPLSLENLNQYNHYTHNLHHFIKKASMQEIRLGIRSEEYNRNLFCCPFGYIWRCIKALPEQT